MHNIYTKIISELQKFFKNTGMDQVVIGVSGGIDSAVCLKLAVDALGPKKVTGLLLPEKGVSLDENTVHARRLCQFLKVEHYTIPINKFLTDYITLPWKVNELAQINSKARVRMMILYNFANSRNAIVLGTSNKTELAIGYGTKHGDLAVDIDILGDLLKEEVYKMAKHLSLPNEFITKTPSAELYRDQTDEAELGMTYKEIDSILKKMEKGMEKEEIINNGLNPNSVHKVFRLMEDNRHKLLPPHIIPIKS